MQNLDSSRRVVAGIVAGLLAGIVMLCMLCAGSVILGERANDQLKLLATAAIGDTALLPSAGITMALYGSITQLTICAVMGAGFSHILKTRDPLRLMFASILFSLLVWIFRQYLWLEASPNYALVVRMRYGLFALSHLAFGVSYALALPWTENRIWPPTVVPHQPLPRHPEIIPLPISRTKKVS